jgi:ABC-type uncharacterized transport system involved in gliding motility auxiliary subunit
MRHTPGSHRQLRIANAVFVLLFLVAVGLLQWLAREYNMRFDLTQTSRHSLSEASIAAVKRLEGPIMATAFVSKRGDLRPRIQALVERYRRHKPDLELRFVDPDESPNEVRAAGIQHEGELILTLAESQERIAAPTRLDEESFTNALTRLGHRGERWIVFLSGHGERSPDRQANFDLSTWGSELRKRGFKTRVLALTEHPRIPANTTMLVIAGPRSRLLPGEVKEIHRYLEHGGNLLWLADPGPLNGLEPLAEALGIEFLPGTVVDLTSRDITGSATAIVVTSYGPHPVVRDFMDATLFPHSGALHFNAPTDWQAAALLDTRASAWLETGPLDKRVAFDKGKDIPGPLTLAVALTKTRDNGADAANVGAREQRVAVIADGDFLSNAFIANAGNLDLGLSLVNWLSQDDAYVSIPVRAARDRRIDLSGTAQLALVLVFLLGLPLAFIGGGVCVWWRRRKR